MTSAVFVVVFIFFKKTKKARMSPMSSAPIGVTLEKSMNIKGIFHTLEANQAVLAVAGQASYIFKEHPVDWRQVGLCSAAPGTS